MPPLRKLTTGIWAYFDITDRKDKFAKCKHCRNEYSYKSTILNLKGHLRRKHLDEYKEMCANEDKEMEVLEDIDDLSRTAEIDSVSPIWDHFEDTDREAKLATCKCCNDIVSYETTTRNLWDHLRETHSEVYEELLPNGLHNVSSDRESVASGAPSGRKRRTSICSVGSEISLPSASRKKRQFRKLTSRIWDHFDITDRTDKNAKCKYCPNSMFYKSTIANLRIHLQRNHLKQYKIMCADKDSELDCTAEIDSVSLIWDHFEDTDKEAKLATCNYCNDVLSYQASTKSLREHLRETHSDAYEELLANGLHDDSSDIDNTPSKLRQRRRLSASSVDSEISSQSASENEPTSSIWAHFDVADKKAKLATCKYCQHTISYKSTKRNLQSHLQNEHLDVFEEMCESGDKYIKQELEMVQDESGRSRRTKVSPIWDSFQDIDPVAKCATCNYCNNTFSYKTTTGNLVSHLRYKHLEVYKELLANKPLNDSSDRENFKFGPAKWRWRETHNEWSPLSNSALWSHFEITDRAAKLATCKYCEKELSYKDTTSILKSHLRKMHTDTYKDMRAKDRGPKAFHDNGRRVRPKVSPIWSHFHDKDRVYKFAICNYCNKKLSYKSSTGNLVAHLRTKHLDAYEEVLANRQYGGGGSDRESLGSAAQSGPTRRMSTLSAESENSPTLWSHFEITDRAAKLATCKYCQDELSYKDTTSILKNHLRKMHTDTNDDMHAKVKHIKREPSALNDNGRLVRTKVSPIWSHFHDKDRESKFAICNYCNKKFSYKTSTGNLVAHLRIKHLDAYKEVLANRQDGCGGSDRESVASAAQSGPTRRMSTWSAESDKPASVNSDPFFVAVPHQLRDIMKIGFLGGGRLAYALASGFISAGLAKGEEITASVHPSDLASADAFKSLGATAIFENIPVVERSDVVLVSVKPGVVSQVLKEVRGSSACKDKLFISVAMGITIKAIESNLPPHARVVRVMPNTPALVRKGAAVYSLGSRATPEDAQLTQQLLESVGTCEQVPEQSMDAVTALSGSGPAYVYMMIEAMAEGGVRAGLPRDLALRLASQTTLGAAAMVQEGEHPAQLKDNVTSPAGSTAEGTYHLEQKGFRAAVIGAVTAAAERCKVVSSQSK